jgi:hypothetical protein
MAIVLAIPEGNDYANATIDKHDRLQKARPPRLIFVGGSSMAFGLDSPTVEKEMPYSVVNMGLMAPVGLRFMLDEIRHEIHEGDVVLLCPDFTTYFTPVDGHGEDLLTMLKARPKSFTYLGSPGQLVNLLGSIPYVASRKVIRRGDRALEIRKTEDPMTDFINGTIGRRANFNEYGDMVGHINVNWPFERESGHLEKLEFDEETIVLINEFYQYARTRGSLVLVMYAPLEETYYNEVKQIIDGLHNRLRKGLHCPIIGSPDEYIFPDEYFFDDVFHLDGHGRIMRTKKVIRDLQIGLGISSACR